MSTSKAAHRTATAEKSERWRFRLFLLGSQPKSTGSLANIRLILQNHLGENFSLEVFDLEKDPRPARENQILMIPTLLRVSPLPHVRLIGTFLDEGLVVAALDLPRSKAGSRH